MNVYNIGQCVIVQIPPPYVPHTKGAGDSRNFEAFEEQPLKTARHDKYEREFKDF